MLVVGIIRGKISPATDLNNVESISRQVNYLKNQSDNEAGREVFMTASATRFPDTPKKRDEGGIEPFHGPCSFKRRLKLSL